MIVGSGQIAKAFQDSEELSQYVIFASGVANSACTDEHEFDREKNLLIKHLNELNGRAIVYFSSCALSADGYLLTPYYEHKKKMECLIKSYTDQYFIFRVPQLFGKMKKHPTLINYLFYAIKEQKEFKVYDGAYRYLIELSDLKKIVLAYIKLKDKGVVLDVANTYRYSILDIVEELEELLSIKAQYHKVRADDSYTIDLSPLERFVHSTDLNITLGKSYLVDKLVK